MAQQPEPSPPPAPSIARSLFGGPPPPYVMKHSRDFHNYATTQAEEDAYDYFAHRRNIKFTSVVESIAHIVKGALGGGILGGHVAYMKCGNSLVALSLNGIIGFYMGFCLYSLVKSAQIVYKRTRMPSLTYADVGEASFKLCPNKTVQNCSTAFRYWIDIIISIDLFGSCCCYQIIIARSIKQVYEDTKEASFEPAYGYSWGLRMYLAVAIPAVVLICLITSLKYLAPFSIAANIVILFVIGVTFFYWTQLNLKLHGILKEPSPVGTLQAIGMLVFSMSCAGVVIPIENNMAEPQKFTRTFFIGMSLIVICASSVAFFGYAAFLRDSDAPITLNFPMVWWTRVLKLLIAIMIYVTHALNFFVPFNIVFYYIKKKLNKDKLFMWELIFRAIFVVICGLIAIAFPDINALMGFIGCFCLSNMAFMWPSIITLLTVWERPGFGKFNWRLWRSVLLFVIGIFIFFVGSFVTAGEMIAVFQKIGSGPSTNVTIDDITTTTTAAPGL